MDTTAIITSDHMEDVRIMESRKPLQLLALNHVSRVCSDLAASYRFYTEVLGFTAVKRPTSFEFEGAWLHNYGIGLHLIKGCPPPRPATINPKSCHISFQAASLSDVEASLVRLNIPFVKNVFNEDGVQVSQLFFHDPDNNMIEICNCDVLPVVPLLKDSAHAVAALTAAPVDGEQMPPPRGPSSGSDAGSDTDSGLQEAFEAASLLSEGIAPHHPDGGGCGGDSDCCDVATPSACAGRDRRLPHHLADDFSSFSSLATSSVVLGPSSLSMMSIAPPELDEWPLLEAAGTGICALPQSEFVVSLKQPMSSA